MESQFCILSILIRPEIQEKVSVGLLFFDSEEILFNFSSKKLSVIKELIPSDSGRLAKDLLKSIKSTLADLHSTYSPRKGMKLFDNSQFDGTFSGNYLKYLSQYSNNTLIFSEPSSISLDVNQENFNRIFCKYISNETFENFSTQKNNPIRIIKSRFEDIEDHYDIQKEITHENVPHLLTPIKIDFLGRNDIDVYVQTLNMEQPYNHIANDVNSFLQLKWTYERNEQPMQNFVIGSEPSKKFSKQHDIWEQIVEQKPFNYIDISESEKIMEYAITHDVKPFFNK